MTTKLLVVDTADPHQMLHAMVAEVADLSNIPFDECQEDDCDTHLENAHTYSIFVVNTARGDALEITRKLYGKPTRAYTIFVGNVTGVNFADLAVGVPRLGNEWALANHNIHDLSRALSHALRRTTQNRQIRTQLHGS